MALSNNIRLGQNFVSDVEVRQGGTRAYQSGAPFLVVQL